MLDIHTHILPGIDDGARTIDIAVALCKELHRQGVTEVVATPHWCSPRFDVEDNGIQAAWDALVAAVAGSVPTLRLHLGAEHHLSGLQQPRAFVESLHPLGRTRCVLIELPDDHLPSIAWQTLFAVCDAGWRPFIAHPERCRGLSNSDRHIREFLMRGGRLQIDLGNLLGMHGWKMRWRSRSMLSSWRSDCVIASDSHNLVARPPAWDRLPNKWRSLVPANLADLERR